MLNASDTDDPWRPFPGCGRQETLPTVAFDRLKPKIEEAIEELEDAKEELNALVLQEITEDCNCEKEKKNQKIRELNKKKKTLIRKSDERITEAKEKTNKETRESLQSFEDEIVDLKSKLQEAKTDHEREVYQLDLRYKCRKAREKSEEYKVFLKKIETETEKLNHHSDRMKAAGATPKKASATKPNTQ